MKLKPVFAAAACVLSLLLSCSSADSTAAGSGNEYEAHVTLADAGVCTSARYGKTVYVVTEDRYYICDGSIWLILPATSSTAPSSTGENADGSSQSGAGTGNSEWNGVSADNGVSSILTDGSSSSAVLGFMCWRNDCAKDMVGHWEGGDSCSYNGRNYIAAYSTNSVPGEVFTAYMTLDECVYPTGQSSWGNMSSSSSSLSSSSSSGPVMGTLTYGGKTYKTVVIGSQTWMAENLNYEYSINHRVFGNSCHPTNCPAYGRLYTWAAAMDSATTGCGYGKECAADTGRVKGICPDGWHLPSQADWNMLFAAVGGRETAGTALKSSSGWFRGRNGTDAYGFWGFPSGYLGLGSGDTDQDQYMRFWSSSEYNQKYAYAMCLSHDSPYASLENVSKSGSYALPVRCVKD